MAGLWAVIFLSVFCGLCAGDEDLQLSLVIFRHGDRAPVFTYPNDPYNDEELWVDGWGQLINTGKQRAFKLGKSIRARYPQIPKRFSAEDVFINSTNVDRALMSAYLVCAGIYEPDILSRNWHPYIFWTPIPVHSKPGSEDSILAAEKACPRYDALMKEVFASDANPVNQYRYASLLREVAAHAGLEGQDTAMAAYLYDTFKVEEGSGLVLPDWTKAYYPEPLTNLTLALFQLPTHTQDMKRLKCGPLLKQIIELMEQKQKGTLSQKLWLFSAHDVTLVNLKRCLDIPVDALPNYSDAIIFELRNKKNDWLVEIFYKSSSIEQIFLPNCGKDCSLERFRDVNQAVIPGNWEEECKL